MNNLNYIPIWFKKQRPYTKGPHIGKLRTKRRRARKIANATKKMQRRRKHS